MKAVFDFLGCLLFAAGVCTPNDSVLLSCAFLSAGGLIIFRHEILVGLWKRSTSLQRLFPGLHGTIYLSSDSKHGGN